MRKFIISYCRRRSLNRKKENIQITNGTHQVFAEKKNRKRKILYEQKKATEGWRWKLKEEKMERRTPGEKAFTTTKEN